MQLTELKNSGLDFHIKVTVPEPQVQSKIETKLDDIQKTLSLKGFRVGKVPKKIVRDRYLVAIKKEVLENVVSDSIRKIIDKEKLNVVDLPLIEELKYEDNSDLEFVAKFETMPEVQIPDLSSIKIEKQVLKVEDKDVEEQLSKMLSSFIEYNQEKSSPATIKDQVIIDATGYVDDLPFEGGQLNEYKLVLGSGRFIAGFEDQLVGASAGDDVIVNVTFPEDYHAKNLKGKPARFDVKIKSVYSGVAPDISEDLLKKMGCETEQELREKIRQRISGEFSSVVETVMKMRLFDKLYQVLDFDLPKTLVEKEMQVLRSQSDIIRNSDEEVAKKSEQEFEQYCLKLASRRVKVGLMISEYIKQKDIKFENSDLMNAVIAEARNYPGQEMQVLDYYKKNPSAVKGIEATVLEGKAIEHMFENGVVVTEKEYDKEQLEKFLEEENKRSAM